MKKYICFLYIWCKKFSICVFIISRYENYNLNMVFIAFQSKKDIL